MLAHFHNYQHNIDTMSFSYWGISAYFLTFDSVCEWHSHRCKWYISHNMSKGMAEGNRSEEQQELLIDRLVS